MGIVCGLQSCAVDKVAAGAGGQIDASTSSRSLQLPPPPSVPPVVFQEGVGLVRREFVHAEPLEVVKITSRGEYSLYREATTVCTSWKSTSSVDMTTFSRPCRMTAVQRV